MSIILDYIYVGISVIIALVCHETAHGLVSYWLGDPTLKQEGRLSLNPFKHLDPIGTLCLFFFHFGWAKPVMINPNYYKNIKLDTALVSLAGPFVNFLLALSGGIVMRVIGYNNFVINFILINIGLCAFNLIPIPPLDGSKVLAVILPEKIYLKYMMIERYGFIILIICLYTNILNFILNPLYMMLLSPIFKIAGLV